MTALPMIAVACATQGCGAAGVVRRVRLKPASLGLVEVPRLRCTGCGCDARTIQGWPAMSIDEATEEATEGTDMPKITVHGGPSNAAESVTAAETPPVEPPAPLDQVGGDAPPAPFDPNTHTVTEVQEYLQAAAGQGDTDEVGRVLEAERAGKARKTLLAEA